MQLYTLVHICWGLRRWQVAAEDPRAAVDCWKTGMESLVPSDDRPPLPIDLSALQRDETAAYCWKLGWQERHFSASSLPGGRADFGQEALVWVIPTLPTIEVVSSTSAAVYVEWSASHYEHRAVVVRSEMSIEERREAYAIHSSSGLGLLLATSPSFVCGLCNGSGRRSSPSAPCLCQGGRVLTLHGRVAIIPGSTRKPPSWA